MQVPQALGSKTAPHQLMSHWIFTPLLWASEPTYQGHTTSKTGLDVLSPQHQIPPITSYDASFLQKNQAKPQRPSLLFLPSVHPTQGVWASPHAPVPFMRQPCFSFPQRAILQHPP